MIQLLGWMGGHIVLCVQPNLSSDFIDGCRASPMIIVPCHLIHSMLEGGFCLILHLRHCWAKPSVASTAELQCRWDISLVSKVPIGTGFGPQNITVITSQESSHQHAFLIRITETHFPHSLETETQLCHKMRLIPTIPTVLHTS